MEKQQTVMDTIHILYESFFEQEKKIANYIMKDHAGVINMTIGELADACGTSVATVSRFCRKCGVDGFHQLKIMLAKEMADSGTGIRYWIISNPQGLCSLWQWAIRYRLH